MFQCRAADPLEWWLLRQKWLLTAQAPDAEWQERELGRCQRNIVALLKLRTWKKPQPMPQFKSKHALSRETKAKLKRLAGHNAHYYEPIDPQWSGGIPGKRIDPDIGKH
jgi:hypothetical protein